MEQLEDLDPVAAILAKNAQFAVGELFSGTYAILCVNLIMPCMFFCPSLSSAPVIMVATKIDAESALMQALAEVEEDKQPDDGEIDITMSPNFLIFILFIIAKM